MSSASSAGSLDLTFKAGADFSAAQFKFVKMSAADTVALCTGATDKPIGVLQNAPGSGGMAVVRMMGVSKVSSDAALTVGLLIGTSADAQADSKVPGTDTTEYICGQVIEASGAAGELAVAVINCANIARAA